MRTRDRLMLLLIAVLGTGFVLGMAQLLRWRFQIGDVYPPYSSLRSDPLGAKAFYESLDELPGIQVSRHYQARGKLNGTKAAVFYLGVSSHSWGSASLKRLQQERQEFTRVTEKGGRLVIAFWPVGPGDMSVAQKPAKEGQKIEGSAPLAEVWGTRFVYQPVPEDKEGTMTQSLVRDTRLFFEPTDPAWQPLQTTQGRVTAMTRPLGQGRLVLLANAYVVSNEALYSSRDTGLLTRLVGPASQIIFDEAHLGVVDDPSLVQMARRYRLQGVLLGFLVLALLFVWRSASSFLPPLPEPSGKDAVAGRDATAGLVNLLRRNISPANLMETCHREWQRGLAQGRAPSTSRQQRVDALLADRSLLRRPVDAYRTMTQILTEKEPSRSA